MRFLFASAALVLATVALAACGGSDNSDASPESVMENATLEGIESADLDAAIEVLMSGAKGGEIDLTLSGPFESVEGGSTPKLDLTAEATGTVDGENVEFEGGLVLLPNSAYVNYKGTDYEVDPTTYSFIESTLEQAQEQGRSEGEAPGASACQKAVAGLEIGDFLENLRNEGEADVGGTSTTKISGDLDVGAAIAALMKLYSDPACSSQLDAAGQLPSMQELKEAQDEFRRSVKIAHADVYVGDDDIIRRIKGETIIKPKGAAGTAKVDFDIRLDGVNEEQEISAPGSARPLEDLFARLKINPLELLGALQGEGSGLENLLEGVQAESTS
jgi:hypothetical protein